MFSVYLVAIIIQTLKLEHKMCVIVYFRQHCSRMPHLKVSKPNFINSAVF